MFYLLPDTLRSGLLAPELVLEAGLYGLGTSPPRDIPTLLPAIGDTKRDNVTKTNIID